MELVVDVFASESEENRGVTYRGAAQTGSQVPSHLRSICAISTVESMEVGTYHFNRGPKS